MKRFTFTLDKVLTWRRLQRDQERNKLEVLIAESARLEQTQGRIRADRATSERAIAHGLSLETVYVSTLPEWQRRTVTTIQSITSQRHKLDAKINEQRVKLREAERQVRLLDQLREKRLSVWKADLLREEEAFAAEAFLARFLRERASGDPSSGDVS